MPLNRLDIKKDDIVSVLLFTGEGIGTAGPRFRVQFNSDFAIEVPLTTKNVEQFLTANPNLTLDIQSMMRTAAAEAKITGSQVLTYSEAEKGYQAHLEKLGKVKKEAADVNSPDSILSPSAEGVMIYTRVPEEVYAMVRESGLKSYASVKGEERSQVIAGHDQSIFFRPAIWHIREEEIEKGPLIGIKVDPYRVLVCNQEIRTISGSEMELHSRYVTSSLTLADFQRQMEFHSKQYPSKYPFSDATGKLLWDTHESGTRRKLLPYIPEVVFNVGNKPILPSQFSHVRDKANDPEPPNYAAASLKS